MPEGDTLEIARQRIAPVLDGQVVRRFWARKLRGHRPRPGQRIEQVRVHGKHLLVDFDRNLTLQVHLGMAGSWSVRPPDADLTRTLRHPQLRVHLGTDRGHALCFSSPTVQTFLRSAELTPVSNLGPDLLVPPEESDRVAAEAARRARTGTSGTTLIVDALLDQGLAAGIGNVYRSEVLFLEGVWPFTPVSSIGDRTLESLYRRASRSLWENSRARPVGDAGRRRHRPRTTTPHLHGPLVRPDRHFVYERHRSPCLRCGTPIRRSYRGTTGRSTYWCPRCQPEPPSEL